jgi:hypothetical protein
MVSLCFLSIAGSLKGMPASVSHQSYWVELVHSGDGPWTRDAGPGKRRLSGTADRGDKMRGSAKGSRSEPAVALEICVHLWFENQLAVFRVFSTSAKASADVARVS